MKKQLFLSLLLIAFVAIFTGCTKPEPTGTLYGVVTDTKTGKPVNSASVELSPIDLIAETGSDGWYQFPEVKCGEYNISVTKTDYVSTEKKEVLIKEGSVRCDVQISQANNFEFEYGGHTYMVAPTSDRVMSLADGISYCEELSLYGFSDWKLPNKEELEQMYINKNYIGGFLDKVYWSSTYASTNIYSADLYYVVFFLTGECGEAHYESLLYVRPIRIKN